MRYITEEEILKLHKSLIDETGGSHGVREVGLLKSAVEQPKATFDSEELYPDVWRKAGSYLKSLVKNHVFVDGNKRVAITTSAYFLHLNGYKFNVSDEEVVEFMNNVAEVDMEIERIAEWLKKNSKESGKNS